MVYLNWPQIRHSRSWLDRRQVFYSHHARSRDRSHRRRLRSRFRRSHRRLRFVQRTNSLERRRKNLSVENLRLKRTRGWVSGRRNGGRRPDSRQNFRSGSVFYSRDVLPRNDVDDAAKVARWSDRSLLNESDWRPRLSSEGQARRGRHGSVRFDSDQRRRTRLNVSKLREEIITCSNINCLKILWVIEGFSVRS